MKSVGQVIEMLQSYYGTIEDTPVSGSEPSCIYRLPGNEWVFYDTLDNNFNELQSGWAADSGLFVAEWALKATTPYAPYFLYLYQLKDGTFIGRKFRTNVTEMNKLSTAGAARPYRQKAGQNGWLVTSELWDKFFENVPQPALAS